MIKKAIATTNAEKTPPLTAETGLLIRKKGQKKANAATIFIVKNSSLERIILISPLRSL